MKIKLILIGLAGLFISMNAISEPSKLQRQMMNEPATMMDLFVRGSQRDLVEEFNNSKIIFQGKQYDFTPAFNKNSELSIRGAISVYLDWERGKWVIEYSYYDRRDKIIKYIELTIKSGRNMCAEMLLNIGSASLNPLYAAHEGFKKELYTAGDWSSFDEVDKNTILKAKLTFLSKSSRKRTTVSCESPYGGIFEDFEYSFTGDWK